MYNVKCKIMGSPAYSCADFKQKQQKQLFIVQVLCTSVICLIIPTGERVPR